MKWSLLLTAILASFTGFGQPSGKDPGNIEQVESMLNVSRKFRWVDSYRSLNYADSALALSLRIGYPEGSAKANNLKGFANWSFGDNELAIQSALDALQYGREQNATNIQAESQSVLARAYLDMAEQGKAWEAILQAESLASKSQDWELRCSIYNLKGVIQFVAHKEDSALVLYNKAFELGKSHSVDPINFPRIISNIGECYAVENPALAFTYFSKALELANKTDNQIAKASITSIIGHAYLRGNDLKLAEDYFEAALQLARSLGLRRVIRQAYSGLVDIKLRQGKGNEAVVYLRKYYDVRDSLLNTSKVRQIVELESKYDLQLKEQNIMILENEQRMQKLLNNLLVGLVVLIILLAIGVFQLQKYRYRKNRKVLDLEIDFLTQRHHETEGKIKESLLPESGKDESLDQKLLREAINSIEEHLADPQFGVEKMAEVMNMSRTSLHRKIKSITGFPPSELIRSMRLRIAARLIQGKTDTVSQIALQVGFDDYSHFSKSFKKHFGVSPTLYEEQASGVKQDGKVEDGR